MTKTTFIPLPDFRFYTVDEMRARAKEFYELVRRRRTVRHFSTREVPREVIDWCIMAAGTAPNGANQQPWHFVVVSDPQVKRQIRWRPRRRKKLFMSGEHRKSGCKPSRR